MSGSYKTKKRILVLSQNEYLIQKIRLELSEYADVFSESDEESDFDITIADLDTIAPHVANGVITVGHTESADMPLPLPLGKLRARIFENGEKENPISLSDTEHSVTLFGEKIKLTDVEYSLMSVLVEKRGDFSAREELMERVWNNERDGGVINVYIHYLREKLEKRGEKIIISSRRYGYKIDEKYFGRAEE